MASKRDWGWKNTFGGGHLKATDFWQKRAEEEGENRVGGGGDLGGRWRKALNGFGWIREDGRGNERDVVMTSDGTSVGKRRSVAGQPQPAKRPMLPAVIAQESPFVMGQNQVQDRFKELKEGKASEPTRPKLAYDRLLDRLAPKIDSSGHVEGGGEEEHEFCKKKPLGWEDPAPFQNYNKRYFLTVESAKGRDKLSVEPSMSLGVLKVLIGARFEVPPFKLRLNVNGEDFLTLQQGRINSNTVVHARWSEASVVHDMEEEERGDRRLLRSHEAGWRRCYICMEETDGSCVGFCKVHGPKILRLWRSSFRSQPTFDLPAQDQEVEIVPVGNQPPRRVLLREHPCLLGPPPPPQPSPALAEAEAALHLMRLMQHWMQNHLMMMRERFESESSTSFATVSAGPAPGWGKRF